MTYKRIAIYILFAVLVSSALGSGLTVYNGGSISTQPGNVEVGTTCANGTSFTADSPSTTYAPGQSWHYTFSCGSPPYNWTVRVTWSAGGGGSQCFTGVSCDDTLTITPGGAPATVTNNVACLTVTNTAYLTGQAWRFTVFYDHGTNQSIPAVNLPLNGTYTLCVTNSSDPFSILACGDRPDFDTPDCHSVNSSQQTSSPALTPDVHPTHTPEQSSPAASTNLDTQNIVRAIKEAADKITKDADSNADEISDNIDELGNRLVEALDDLNITNGTSIPTNLLSSDYMNSASNSVRNGMSGHGAVTNSSAAYSAASNEFGGTYLGQYDTAGGYSSSMTNGTGFTTVSSPPSGLSFAFCGTTLDLDPETWMPGILGIIKNVWTFILLAMFSLWVGKRMMEVASAMAIMPGGGVPDLELTAAGFGGNVAGIAVAALVPLAIIALVVLVGNVIFGAVLGWLGLLPAASTALGLGGNQIALYLLSQSFPVSLFFSLLSARITLQFTAAKLVTLGAGASRWLWTK